MLTHAGSEAFASLLDDVEAKVFGRLPDDTWFSPGHGNDSTLGAERPALPEWRARGCSPACPPFPARRRGP